MTEILTSNKLIKISKVGLMLLTCMLVTSWQPEIIFANESNSTETEQVVNKNVSFSEVVPYSQFLNYQYLGDGSEFSSQDIIKIGRASCRERV